jgi:plastocyanin
VLRANFLFLLVLAITSSVALVPVHAQDAGQAAINIVEPPSQPALNWTFDPNDITVPLGATVTWTNTGATGHTVTSDDDGASFDSGNVDPGATFSFTATAPGTFTYHCGFHPWMTGSLTVTS